MMSRFKASNVQPGAWWLLGLSLAIAASLSTNSLVLLGLAGACVTIIALARDKSAPWSNSLKFYLLLAAAVVLLRLAFRIIFNFSTFEGPVLFELPALTVDLGFGSPISLFGRVSSASMQAALSDGMRLAAIILSIALANSLANPRKLLKSTPAALYEVATAISVAINLAPQLIESLQRVRRARSLRGRSSGLGALAGIVIPALEDTIDKSLSLAASMDSRGFGRRGTMSDSAVRAARTFTLVAICLVLIGSYLLLTAGAALLIALSCIGLGVAFLAMATRLTSKGSNRTRYNRNPWVIQDFSILGFGISIVVAAVLGMGV